MIICYIDESGVPEIPGNSSHFVLAGFAIPIKYWKKCEKEIQKIKNKFNLTDAEIHTAWILRKYPEQNKIPNFEKLDWNKRISEVSKQRNSLIYSLQKNPTQNKRYKATKKNFEKTKDYVHLTYDERKQFIIEITELISKWKFVRLFAECIDKIHFDQSKTPLSINEQAFEQLVSRFAQYLKIYSATSRKKQFGLLVHDNNQSVNKKHTAIMKDFHKRGTFWTKIPNIIETPMFVDSELTSMVQIADICAYALRRYIENSEDFLFNKIINIADRKNGKKVGVRHFSSNTCKCKICVNH